MLACMGHGEKKKEYAHTHTHTHTRARAGVPMPFLPQLFGGACTTRQEKTSKHGTTIMHFYATCFFCAPGAMLLAPEPPCESKLAAARIRSLGLESRNMECCRTFVSPRPL